MKLGYKITILLAGVIVFFTITKVSQAQVPTEPSCSLFTPASPGVIPDPPNDATCSLAATATDIEGDRIYYVFDWGDGTTTRVPSITGSMPAGAGCATWVNGESTVTSGTKCGAINNYGDVGSLPGTYSAFAVAYDEAGHQSVNSDSVVVSIISQVLSATITAVPPTPSTPGWYNAPDQWIFDATCKAAAGWFLSDCIFEYSENFVGWIVLSDPNTTGQSIYTYQPSLDMDSFSGVGFRFRLRASDTDPNTGELIAYLPADDEEISYDIDLPGAILTSPTANQASEFQVTATLFDTPNQFGGPNSGISTWDLEFQANGGAWQPCVTNEVPFGQGVPMTSDNVTFGSGCTAASGGSYTLVPNTTYCFQARVRDSTLPGPNQSGWYAGDNCTPYLVSAPPNTPSDPKPVDGGQSTYRPQLSWDGGDPDVPPEPIDYSIYLSSSDSTPYDTTPPIDPTENRIGQLLDIPGNIWDDIKYPSSGTLNLTQGGHYYWQIVAQDIYSTVAGPVWDFTANSQTIIENVDIDPSVVNKSATITWEASDADGPPSLDFIIYYGSSAMLQVDPEVIDNTTTADCTWDGVLHKWFCSYDWDSTCVPEPELPEDLYIKIEAWDGFDWAEGTSCPGAPAACNSFQINHTETVTVGPGTVGDDEEVKFWIEPGSLEPGASLIQFSGTCSEITADANEVGNESRCGGSSGNSCNGGFIPLYDLHQASESCPGGLPCVSTNNTVKFQLTGCTETSYEIRYNIAPACGESYISVEEGSIYSQGSIKGEIAPPSGNYNASYLILGGGSGSGTTIYIENFVSKWPTSPQGDVPVNANFGQLLYPEESSSFSPRVGSFDYYGLTNNLNDQEVADGEKNSYGHKVEITSAATAGGDVILSEVFGGANQAPLEGKVYWIKGSNLEVSGSQFTFENTTGDTSGAGLIIVDGNLTINNDLDYQPTNNPSLTSRNFASVGWLVRGDVFINGNVGKISGAFYVSGTQTGNGIFSTGVGGQQLIIKGAVIAKKFELQRASAGGAPSEMVIADGRILLNTPPGFIDIISTLPTWRFRTPGP
ncbi:MAG: hypothetical protein UW06_C0004G0025 [Parcubacteria group bacterium GW2011_GWE1_43_8]|nr:MAG: hypothetical protein UW06_C0004G0025 [Parcubacteria group bacterium GW2011_GWE1_43_8]HBZ36144.1 hypothetical protein [Candidatus Veblenbacteria bacterium]